MGNSKTERKTIEEKILKCFCKIYKNNKIIGSGFFIKIPNLNLLVMITKFSILSEKDLEKNGIITILINNELNFKYINIDDSRMIFTYETFDITIIEIKASDYILHYIEIDDRIKEEKLEEIYYNKPIYTIVNCKNKKNIKIEPFGTIINITGQDINYINDKKKNNLNDSQIILSDNLKIIGICSQNKKEKKCDKIIFIKYFINEFDIKIKKRQKLNEINIYYKININDKKLKLFGRKFIENNKDNGIMIIEGKEKEISEYIDIDDNLKNKEILHIKFKEIKRITNMSYIFGRYYGQEDWGSSLISVPDISDWNMEFVTNISGMFAFCSSLSTLPDISKWITNNITDINYLFNYCKSLIFLPDISVWNTSKVSNMHNLFNHCEMLSSLPDISKWDTSNVTDMSFMLSFCQSLTTIPDLSKLNFQNVKDFSSMFFNCPSLSFVPNINYSYIKQKYKYYFIHEDCLNLINYLPKYN